MIEDPETATPHRLVVVEDDDDIRRLLTTFLTDAGHEVHATGEPGLALDLIRRTDPQLVLCDIAMPGMDGHQVLRALHADPETAGYPVMFVTAHREFSERIEAFKFGVVDYLTKPFTRDMLMRKVTRALEGRSQRTGRVRAEGDPSALVAELKRDRRTGLLRVEGPGGTRSAIVRDGEVVGGAAPDSDSSAAEFEELDPRREQIAAPDPPETPAPPTGVSFDEVPAAFRSLLLVDDDAEFRSVLRGIMETHGFVVREASDGATALEAALEHRPWLILADVAMPGMDGVELCRRVRQHTLIRHTPFIFLSGWDDYRRRNQGIEAGADEFVSKTSPVRDLLIRVQLVLSRYVRYGPTRDRGAGMDGRLDLVGAAGVLQMLHLGRLTGRLHVRAEEGSADVTFRDGEIVDVTSGTLSGTPALMTYLSWDGGRFQFVPGEVGDAPPLGQTFAQLLLEASRQLDERLRR